MLALVVGVGAAGCDHLTDPAGPNLTDRFGDFNFVEPVAASQPTVDFAGGEDVAFSATFNKQAAWVLLITGQESGAVKRIEGFSNVLDATNATWNGGTTELPFFKEETVDVALFVPSEETDTLRTTVEVVSPRTYPGNVFADFEGGENIFIGNFEFEFQIGLANMDMAPAIETVFLLTEPKNIFVSSSLVKEIATNGGDVSRYLPEPAFRELARRLQEL